MNREEVDVARNARLNQGASGVKRLLHTDRKLLRTEKGGCMKCIFLDLHART